jgi:hypothetical protein
VLAAAVLGARSSANQKGGLLPPNTRNTLEKYQCGTCNKVEVVSGDKKLKYYVAQAEGGGCSLCPNPNPAIREAV